MTAGNKGLFGSELMLCLTDSMSNQLVRLIYSTLFLMFPNSFEVSPIWTLCSKSSTFWGLIHAVWGQICAVDWQLLHATVYKCV